MRKLIQLVLLLCVSSAVNVFAEAPNLLTYQGRLKEGGQAVSGNRLVEIQLCDDISAGNCYTTSPTPQSVAVSNGLFRSTFTVPSTANFGAGNWYLEIWVAGTRLTPREQLTSTAYSLFSATAAYATNISAADGSDGVHISSDLYVTSGKYHGDGSALTNLPVSGGAVAKAGDTMAGQLTLAGSTLTVRGNAFSVGGSTLVVANGSIGIGVANPAPGYFMQVSVPGEARLDIVGTGKTAQINRRSNRLEFFSDDDITLAPNFGVEAVRVQATGNVGIGTATPLYRLVVSSGAGETGPLFAVSTGTTDVFYVSGDGAHATKFHGDGSGLTNVPVAGDNLGNHTAAQALNMNGYAVWSSSSITAAGYQIGGNTVLAAAPGNHNLSLGASASAPTGSYNAFIGDGAGNANLAASIHNTFVGAQSGYYGTTGADNALFGFQAGQKNVIGSGNTLIGGQAGGAGSTGTGSFSSTTVVGYMSGYNLLSPSANNIFLGWKAGYYVQHGAGNIVIGYNQDTSGADANNELNIGGVLYGDLAGKTIGISTRTPQAALDIVAPGTYAQIWRQADGTVVASMTAAGQFSVLANTAVAAADITTNGIIISTGGAIQTTGGGYSGVTGGARGFGAVDLQTNRQAATHVASGSYAVLGGGEQNTAGGHAATVSGGYQNSALMDYSSVVGGYQNTANWTYAVVAGGQSNQATGESSSVSGGRNNQANSYYSAVAGGIDNHATAQGAFVGGGASNAASGNSSVVPGGSQNTAGGQYSFAAGYKSSSTANGTFTWADSQGADLINNVVDQVRFKAAGGFWVSTGTVYANPALFVDASNNVGVGTNSPEALLHVAGSMISGQHDVVNAVGAPTLRLQAAGTEADIIPLGGELRLWDSGTPKVWLNSSGLGIGTAGPAYKLDVNGDMNLSAGSSYRIGGVIQTGSSKWTAGTGNDIYRNLGNVGIGTTGPGARLEVDGNVKIVDGTQGAGRVLTSDASGLAAWQVAPSSFSVGQSFGGGTIFWVDPAGKQVLIAATADQNTGIRWSNNLNATGANLDGIYSGKANTVIISTMQHAGSYAAQVCADYSVTVNGEYYDDWYLPSTSELSLLYARKDVVGGFNTSATYWTSNEYVPNPMYAWVVSFNSGTVYSNTDKSSPVYVRCVRGGPSTSIGNIPTNAETVTNGAYVASTQTFTGQNAFQNQVTVSSSLVVLNGNVGIGTQTPASILALSRYSADPVVISIDNAGYSSQNASFGVEYNGLTLSHYYTSGADPTTQFIRFMTGQSSAVERMRITSAGNVGIGTTIPAARLNVDGTTLINANYPLLLSNNAPYGSGIRNDQAGSESLIIAARNTASKIFIGTGFDVSANPGSAITLPANPEITVSNGNVGIGTSAPSSALTVAGAIATTPPQTITASFYSVTPVDSSLIFNLGSPATLNLPAASAYPGRILHIKTIQSSVASASANVLPLNSATPDTPILTTLGNWAMLQSDGTYWVIMAAN